MKNIKNKLASLFGVHESEDGTLEVFKENRPVTTKEVRSHLPQGEKRKYKLTLVTTSRFPFVKVKYLGGDDGEESS